MERKEEEKGQSSIPAVLFPTFCPDVFERSLVTGAGNSGVKGTH